MHIGVEKGYRLTLEQSAKLGVHLQMCEVGLRPIIYPQQLIFASMVVSIAIWLLIYLSYSIQHGRKFVSVTWFHLFVLLCKKNFVIE